MTQNQFLDNIILLVDKIELFIRDIFRGVFNFDTEPLRRFNVYTMYNGSLIHAHITKDSYLSDPKYVLKTHFNSRLKYNKEVHCG